jgi:hypothetical protein
MFGERYSPLVDVDFGPFAAVDGMACITQFNSLVTGIQPD